MLVIGRKENEPVVITHTGSHEVIRVIPGRFEQGGIRLAFDDSLRNFEVVREELIGRERSHTPVRSVTFQVMASETGFRYWSPRNSNLTLDRVTIEIAGRLGYLPDTDAWDESPNDPGWYLSQTLLGLVNELTEAGHRVSFRSQARVLTSLYKSLPERREVAL